MQAYEAAIDADLSVSGIFNISYDNYTIGSLAEEIKVELQEHNIDVSIDFTVLHEKTLGWGGNTFSQPLFPYGVAPMSVDAAAEAAGRLASAREGTPVDPDAERNEQQRQAALRRYATLGGKARMKKDLVWLNKMNAKEPGDVTEAQRTNMAYLSQTLEGAGVAPDLMDIGHGGGYNRALRGAAGEYYDEFIE